MKLRSNRSRAAAVAAAAVLGCAIGAPAAFAEAPNFTWTGQSESPSWSQNSNWRGGDSSPVTDEPIDTLTFGALGGKCSEETSEQSTCYFSENDIAGLSVYQLDFADGAPYDIEGGTIALGAGGIVARPGLKAPALRSRSALQRAEAQARRGMPMLAPRSSRLARMLAPRDVVEESGSQPLLSAPLVLTAPQTWSIKGQTGSGGNNLEIGDGLEIASVSGDDPLDLDFTDNSLLDVDGNTEAGPITATGSGVIEPGGSVNGVSGNPVTLEDGAGLDFSSPGSTAGPLTVQSHALIGAVDGVSPEATLAINGGMTLGSTATVAMAIDEPGTKASTDFSQITAAGDIDLGGAHLRLIQGGTAGFKCESLKAKDVDTLISTTGTLSGTFASTPNGATVKIQNYCNSASVNATAVIRYTSHAVTAALDRGGNASNVPLSIRAPKLSGKLEEGHKLTVSRGSWSGKPTSFRYEWLRCSDFTGRCVDLRKVHGRTYTPTAKAVGSVVLVEIIAQNKAGKGFSGAYTRGVVKAPSKASIKLALRRVVRQHGEVFKMTSPSGGKLKLTWSARDAGKRVTVGRVTVRFAKSKLRRFRLKLTGAGKRLLKQSPTLTVTAKATFTPTDGKTVTVGKKVKLAANVN